MTTEAVRRLLEREAETDDRNEAIELLDEAEEALDAVDDEDAPELSRELESRRRAVMEADAYRGGSGTSFKDHDERPPD